MLNIIAIINMRLTWQITDSTIIGRALDNPQETISTNTNIILFDLDGTLIKTQSGKTFPTHKDDWVFLDQKVVSKLNTTNNTIFGIITNQRGLKNEKMISEWISKINDIVTYIPIHFVIASLKYDKYSKPLIGSWQYAKEHYFPHLNPEKEKTIFYIGDAFGRKFDHSDSDLKFAINCGFKYQTPEKYFELSSYNPNNACSVTIPNLEYYTNEEFSNIINQITHLINTNNKIYITLSGLPASGKTYLRNYLLTTNSDKHILCLNNDEKRIFNTNNHKNINIIIDDNTNLVFSSLQCNNNKHFSDYLKLFIEFDHSYETLQHLNGLRTFHYNKNIPKIVYNMMKKKMTNILCKEGDILIVIDKIFPELKFENGLQYYC